MVHLRSWVLVLMPGMVPVRACALPAATNLMMTCRRGHDV